MIIPAAKPGFIHDAGGDDPRVRPLRHHHAPQLKTSLASFCHELISAAAAAARYIKYTVCQESTEALRAS